MEKSKAFSRAAASILGLITWTSAALADGMDVIRNSAAEPFVAFLQSRYDFELRVPIAYRPPQEPQVDRTTRSCILHTGYSEDQLETREVREWIITYTLRAALQCATPPPQNAITTHAQHVAADLFAILVLRSAGSDQPARRLFALRLASAPRSCLMDTAPWLHRAMNLPQDQIPHEPGNLFTLLRSMQPDEEDLAQTLNRREAARQLLTGVESQCIDLRYTLASDSQAQDTARIIESDYQRAIDWISADSVPVPKHLGVN